MEDALHGSVFVTGCSRTRGIGVALVKNLLNQDVPPKHLFATCRSLSSKGAEELAKLAAKHANLHLLELDVCETSHLPEIVQQVNTIAGDGGLSVLVNNAGVYGAYTLENIQADTMRRAFEVNTVAPLMIIKHFLPLLRQAATSTSPSIIVNVSSLTSSFSDNKSGGSYDSRPSKAALNMITKSLSVDLSDDSIVAVAFNPGWVKTDMGGPEAKITTEESTNGLIKVVSSLRLSSSGSFLDYTGNVVPW